MKKSSPEKIGVSDKDNKINPLVLGLILTASVVFYIVISYGADIEEEFDVIDTLYLLGIASCFTASFLVSKKFGKAKIFGRAYLLLGIAFVFYFVGESAYMYYETVLKIDPYPAPLVDSFYWGFYPLVIAHMIINIRFFKKKFLVTDAFVLVGSTMAGISAYYLSTFNIEIDAFDFNYGLISIVFASIALSFSLLGSTIFRNTVLKSIWLLLALGLSLSTAADIWYYSAEAIGDYDLTHPVNTLYMASWMVIVYALYKHIKTFP